MSKILNPVSVQITYAKKSESECQEIELLRFSNSESADRFLTSISKNPDVIRAIRV